MEGDVIANRTDLSRMQVGEHLNSAKFNVILRCGNNTEIVFCGKRASIIVVEKGCEGRDFLSSRQPESCPKPFPRLQLMLWRVSVSASFCCFCHMYCGDLYRLRKPWLQMIQIFKTILIHARGSAQIFFLFEWLDVLKYLGELPKMVLLLLPPECHVAKCPEFNCVRACTCACGLESLVHSGTPAADRSHLS